MPNSSPLIQLIEALERVKATAAQHHAIIGHSEADTRQAIINPILQVLGWDLTNLDQVRVEIIEGGYRIDYGLLDRTGCIKAIVEAKKVGTNLQQMAIVNSVAAYALVHGIPNVFLTDGLVWNHYTNFQPGQMQAEEIDLLNQSLLECATFFVKHLDAAHFWYQSPIVNQHNLAANPMTQLNQPQREFVSIGGIPENLTGHHVGAIRLPNGVVMQVNSWAKALKEFCLYVLQKVNDLPVPLVDQAGGNVDLLRLIEPGHDRNYTPVEYNGRNIFIYLGFSANGCVKNMRYILSKLPPNEGIGQAAILLRD